MLTQKINFLTLLALCVLLPLFFLPGGVVMLGVGKTILVVVCALIVTGLFVWQTLEKGELGLPWHPIFVVVILLPAVYLLSGLLNNPKGILGTALEVGSFGSILFGTLILLLLPLIVRERGAMLRLFMLLGGTLGLITILGLLNVLFHGGLFGFALPGNMGNPLGVWTDYAVGAALANLISLLALDLLELKKLWRWFNYIIFFASLILLALINFSIAWFLLLGASILLMVYSVTIERRINDGVQRNRFSRLALLVLIVSAIFAYNPSLPGGKNLTTALSDNFQIQNLDIRPSFSATLAATKPVLGSQLLLGAGPNSFSDLWFLSKPKDVNQTAFWNTSFAYGVGFLTTQISATGILGGAVWLAFLVLIFLLGIKSLATNLERRERFLITTSFLLSLVTWLSFLVYIPGVANFYLAFLLTGFFLAGLVSAGVVPLRIINFKTSALKNFATVLVMAFVVLGLLATTYLSAKKVLATVYYQQALQLAASATPTSADIAKVEDKIKSALNFSQQDNFYRLLSQVDLAKAQTAYNSSDGTVDERRQTFQAALSDGIANAQKAVSLDQESYANWLGLGSIYAALVPAPLAVNGAYENALKAFAEAKKRNPLSPEIPLLMARLENDKGNTGQARVDIAESLSLKQDYADAYFLLTQMEVADNNISSAIASAQTAALLSPDNAGIFFELGLLEYSNHDYVNARDALAKAVSLVPDYANAKYFLGLSLNKLGDTPDAIQLFTDLQTTNPDNADLGVIIANLKNGKDALYQAPSGAHPEKQPVPPISSN